eukprot:IDg9642t1
MQIRHLLDTVDSGWTGGPLKIECELICLSVSLSRDFRVISRAQHRDTGLNLHRRNARHLSSESERSQCFIGYHQRESFMLTDEALESRQVPVPGWWANDYWIADGLGCRAAGLRVLLAFMASR